MEIFGLAGLLNSTFMDKYFRTISGNTQVNATEVRTLKIPDRNIIRKIGARLIESKQYCQNHIDKIVNMELDYSNG